MGDKTRMALLRNVSEICCTDFSLIFSQNGTKGSTRNLTSNFGQLLLHLGANLHDLQHALNIDKNLATLLYKGKQKWDQDNAIAAVAAEYLLQLDQKLLEPVIPFLLTTYFPEDFAPTTSKETADKDSTLTSDKQKEYLIQWLEQFGHCPVQYSQEKKKTQTVKKKKFDHLSNSPVLPDPHPSDPLPTTQNAVAFGLQGVQESSLQFIRLITQQTQPTQMQFACPEGLNMLTRGMDFHPQFMDALMKMFAAGHTLVVIICKDYQVSDVAEFSGRWLAAHLLGYIQSYYYDDHHASSKVKFLAAAPGLSAGRVHETKDGKLFACIRFDEATIDETCAVIQDYRACGRQSFHYHLFESPAGFLRGIHPLPNHAHYLYSRLPQFCLTDVYGIQDALQLSDEESDKLWLDYSLLFWSPDALDEDTRARHIFCEDDIEKVLFNEHRTGAELSTIIGRPVTINATLLLKQLVHVKSLLLTKKHYRVCFLCDASFTELTMQIACWGNRAAIAWIPDNKSTACKDPVNVNALVGFCEMIWKKIPAPMKARRYSLQKINAWLKKAKKLGYTI